MEENTPFRFKRNKDDLNYGQTPRITIEELETNGSAGWYLLAGLIAAIVIMVGAQFYGQ